MTYEEGLQVARDKAGDIAVFHYQDPESALKEARAGGAAIYRTSPRPYPDGIDGLYQNAVVVETDGQYLVQQEDLEDGEVWNVTPVRSFDMEEDAMAFAEMGEVSL